MSGVSLLIHPAFGADMVCRFDSFEEGFNFGHAFLKARTTVPAAEKIFADAKLWTDDKGALMAYDYWAGDSLETICSLEEGHVGSGTSFQLFLRKGFDGLLGVEVTQMMAMGQQNLNEG